MCSVTVEGTLIMIVSVGISLFSTIDIHVLHIQEEECFLSKDIVQLEKTYRTLGQAAGY